MPRIYHVLAVSFRYSFQLNRCEVNDEQMLFPYAAKLKLCNKKYPKDLFQTRSMAMKRKGIKISSNKTFFGC